MGSVGREVGIEAGYSPNGAAQSASRLLKNAEIQARINVLRNAMAERAIDRAALTRGYVIERLMTIVDQCSQLEPIRDKYGNIVGYSRYNPTAAIRALIWLGKELGMFKGPPEVKSEFSDMSLEELKQRSAELERKLEELRRQEELERQTEPKRLRKPRGPLH